jgi:hypothetical protein
MLAADGGWTGKAEGEAGDVVCAVRNHCGNH